MRVDNVARVRDAFRAFAERDAITVGRLIGNEVVWRVPGRSAMAGVYQGRAEIFEEGDRHAAHRPWCRPHQCPPRLGDLA